MAGEGYSLAFLQKRSDILADVNRNYYAIMPANVRYDNEITASTKLLYCEITALCNEKGYCWANNEYFAELYSVSERSISRWISKLIKKGYITVDFQYKNGTKEILKRYIRLAGNSSITSEGQNPEGGDKIVNGCRQNCHLGGDKNVQDNIINNNIIINNNSHSGENEKPKNDYEKVMDLYARLCTKLPKVIKLTDKRKKSIKKLLGLYSWEELEKAFKVINNSNFCAGNNDRGWKADFDFCINTEKITSALEGKYSNDFTPKTIQPKAKPNKFHNFNSKMADIGESRLEEIAKKKFEQLKGD